MISGSKEKYHFHFFSVLMRLQVLYEKLRGPEMFLTNPARGYCSFSCKLERD